MNMKNTVTFTAEMTLITERKGELTAEGVKDGLLNLYGADDVHIENFKLFEGTEGGHE